MFFGRSQECWDAFVLVPATVGATCTAGFKFWPAHVGCTPSVMAYFFFTVRRGMIQRSDQMSRGDGRR